jgi:predicted CopG family antitoxin
MAKQVALSDRAYARLRRNRIEGESFSDAVERLMDSQPKDPLRFLAHMRDVPKPGYYHQRIARIEREREATRGPV